MAGPKKRRRSQEWFGREGKMGFIYRSWVKNRGVPHDQFDGRPVIGICNTYSELTPCNSHFRTLAEHVKAGVWEAGGFPLEFPVMSLGETLLRPTAMLYRNLASMDVEESIRGNPIDGVVLLMGCDKTTPSLLMGASSVDLPTIGVSGGPMLSGWYKGERIGSGTNTWSLSEELRAGKITQDEFHEAESCMHRSHGHCMVMGTASTMASMVEALGVGLPGNAAFPAVDARRNVIARMAGRRIVGMVKEDLRLSKILTRRAFENAMRVNAAIGGSTNAVIHLIAIARRIGVKLDLDDWDRFGKGVHTLVNLMPNGKYLMEDFCYAGGLPVVIRELGEAGLLNKDALTANGKSIWENSRDARNDGPEVIMSMKKPFKRDTGIAVLRGNLCPDGAIIKPSAATPKLMKHKGRAVVFEDIEDFHARVDDPKLDIDERELRDGAQELRAARVSRHGRGGQHAAAEEAAQEGHHGHGACLGRTHERHGLRDGGAACRARGGRRRAARAGARRRPGRARRGEAAPAPARERKGARRAPPRVEAAEAADGPRLLAPLRGAREPGERGRRPRLPRGQERFRRASRQPLIPGSRCPASS
jgi:dihydroxy-acid dehydratase